MGFLGGESTRKKCLNIAWQGNQNHFSKTREFLRCKLGNLRLMVGIVLMDSFTHKWSFHQSCSKNSKSKYKGHICTRIFGETREQHIF